MDDLQEAFIDNWQRVLTEDKMDMDYGIQSPTVSEESL